MTDGEVNLKQVAKLPGRAAVALFVKHYSTANKTRGSNLIATKRS